jgi:hypothetical protein
VVAVVDQGAAHNTQVVLAVLVVVMRLTKAHRAVLEQVVKALLVEVVQIPVVAVVVVVDL